MLGNLSKGRTKCDQRTEMARVISVASRGSATYDQLNRFAHDLQHCPDNVVRVLIVLHLKHSRRGLPHCGHHNALAKFIAFQSSNNSMYGRKANFARTAAAVYAASDTVHWSLSCPT